MPNCEHCGWYAKPSWSQDWFIPHKFCSEFCYDEYSELEEEKEREDLENSTD
jgi:hypothetical protein